MKKLVLICNVGLTFAATDLMAHTSAAAKAPETGVVEADVKRTDVDDRARKMEIELSQLLYVPFAQQPVIERSVQYANEALAAIIDCDVKRAFWNLGYIAVPSVRKEVIEKFFTLCPVQRCKASDLRDLRRVNKVMLLGSFFVNAKASYLPQADFADLLIFVGNRALEYHQRTTTPAQDFLVNRCTLELEALQWMLDWTRKHQHGFKTPADRLVAQRKLEKNADDVKHGQMIMKKRLIRYRQKMKAQNGASSASQSPKK